MYRAEFLHKENLAGDIWSFVFSVPDGFTWHGGEHVAIVLEHAHVDSRGITRVLSIASAPHEKQLQFVTHCPDEMSSFKKALLALEPHATVEVTPAQDSFHPVRIEDCENYIVGGVGISTVRSMLLDYDHRGNSLNGTLFYYAPPGQHLFKSGFATLAAKHPEFTVHYIDMANLEEKGAVKEVEALPGSTYFFSGVYTKEMLTHEAVASHAATNTDPDERKEVEFLAKASGLVK